MSTSAEMLQSSGNQTAPNHAGRCALQADSLRHDQSTWKHSGMLEQFLRGNRSPRQSASEKPGISRQIGRRGCPRTRRRGIRILRGIECVVVMPNRALGAHERDALYDAARQSRLAAELQVQKPPDRRCTRDQSRSHGRPCSASSSGTPRRRSLERLDLAIDALRSASATPAEAGGRTYRRGHVRLDIKRDNTVHPVGFLR